MSYDDYLALPETVRAEWVDGEVVVTPSPSYRHQRSSLRLAGSLDSGLPGLFVVEATSLHLPVNRERIPDILVLDREPETPHVDFPPVLVVEILSPSTRSEDTVRKSTDYLAGGVRQYWLLDPEGRSLEVFRNDDSGWTLLARADDAQPSVRVPVFEHGDVQVDLTTILPPD